MNRITTVPIVLAALMLAAAPVRADKQTVNLTHRLLTDNSLLAKLGNPGLKWCPPGVNYIEGRGDLPAFKSQKPICFVLQEPSSMVTDWVGFSDVPPPPTPFVVLDRSGGDKGPYDTLYTCFTTRLSVDKQQPDGGFITVPSTDSSNTDVADPPSDVLQQLVGGPVPILPTEVSQWQKYEGKPAEIPGGGRGMDFGVIAIPHPEVPVHGAAHLRVWAIEKPGETDGVPNITFYSCLGCCLEGKAKIEGKTQTSRLLDPDLDGWFNGFVKDEVAIGNDPPMQLAEVIAYHGKLYGIARPSDNDQSSVIFSSFEGSTGNLVIRPKLKSAKLESVDGTVSGQYANELRVKSDATGKILLPASGWRIGDIELGIRDGDRGWIAEITRNEPFDVKVNKDNLLEIGMPLRIEVTTPGSKAPGSEATIGYAIKGIAGEEYTSIVTAGTDQLRAIDTLKGTVKDASGKLLGDVRLQPG